MSIVLYGMYRSPPCQGVLLLAKAISVDVHLKEIDTFNNEHQTESFLKMNPAHSVPTLDDKGFHIWESHAILGYLVDQYAKSDSLYPKEPKLRAQVNNILYFDVSLFQSLAEYLFPPIFKGIAPDPEKETYMKDRLTILNTILSRNVYAAGDRLTIADISTIASLYVTTGLKYPLDAYPNIIKWRTKVETEIPHYNEVAQKSMGELNKLLNSKSSN